jgi:molybdate transport system permease protein
MMTSGPLFLSFQIAVQATVLALLIGLPLAWVLARKKFPGRDLYTVLILLPMVLPPTVLGYYLLVVIGREGVVGRAVATLGVDRLVFTPAAAVLAAFVASVPFLVLAARAGFEQVDQVYEEAARTLGRSEWAIAFTVTLPLAWRGIVAGTALTFARAMGEFGATVMVAGSIPGSTRTASIAIYDAVQAGRMDEANLMALLLTLTTTVVLLLITRLGRGVGW